MESPIVTFEQLCSISGYTRPADVAAWLSRNNVEYFSSKYSRPTTSTVSLNVALGIPPPTKRQVECAIKYNRVAKYKSALRHFDLTPDGKHHELYRYFDAEDNLLYVGISASAVKRYGEHKKKKSWIFSVDRIEIERYPNREYLLRIEEMIIREEKPKHNIKYNEAAR